MISALWEKYPALFVGIALLCGCGFALDCRLPFLLPLVACGAVFSFHPRRVLLICLLCAVSLTGFGITKMRYSPPPGKEKVWKGKGLFSPKSFRINASPFQNSWRYDGVFKWFEGEEKFSHLPCTIFLPLKTEPPAADSDYVLEGVLKRTRDHHFFFKQAKNIPWKVAKQSFNLAHMRWEAKEKIRHYLKKHLPHQTSYDFLSALATGEMENRALSFDFGSLGLQHLLAISGFHFGLITLMLSFFLRLFFSPGLTASLLLPLITFYFFFIGDAPSCQRAWIAISLFLISHLFSWRTSGLNIIGVCLICALVIDPLVATHLGFQLSFLITLSILLFYPLFEKVFSSLLPPRAYRNLLNMSGLDQHGYLFSATLRKALALGAAVHLFAVPATLFFFGKFPLLSLLYNLFFPFWVGLSLLLLLVGLILTPLPWISAAIHSLNSAYTSWLVTLTSHPPLFFHFFLRIKEVPLWAIVGYFTLLFWLGMWLKERVDANSLTESTF